jgi:hypothetical protein
VNGNDGGEVFFHWGLKSRFQRIAIKDS